MIDNRDIESDVPQKLTLWHTYQQGTILSGTKKGDAANQILKESGLPWKWSPHIITPTGQRGAWYIQSSREKPANNAEIERAFEELYAAGYEVYVNIDNMPRNMEAAEADRMSRWNHRAQALADKSTQHRDAADKLHDDAMRLLPNNGQPLLVDHYSYAADLARRKRGEVKLDHSAALTNAANDFERQAESTREHIHFRSEPFQVARRIRALEIDLRAWRRVLHGKEQWHTNSDGTAVWKHVEPTQPEADRARDQIAYYENQLTYWKDVRQRQVNNGHVPDFGNDDIASGDYIQYRNHWYQVAKVNKKTVTVNIWQSQSGEWHTDRITNQKLFI